MTGRAFLPLQVFAGDAALVVGHGQEVLPAGLESFKPHAHSSEFVLNHIPFDGHQILASTGAEGRSAFRLEPVELRADAVTEACLK